MSEFEFEPGELVTVDTLHDWVYYLYVSPDRLSRENVIEARGREIGVMVALEQYWSFNCGLVMTRVFVPRFGIKWIPTRNLVRA